ncbi:hypothetical protein PUN28_004624 [Cardiocondyla obscurior]|uniref:Uncharacterized protein n=1 Tax=Cardiocondyla obscurior TaxID=286306 RepID=A0AAW2GEU7_9HYME
MDEEESTLFVSPLVVGSFFIFSVLCSCFIVSLSTPSSLISCFTIPFSVLLGQYSLMRNS